MKSIWITEKPKFPRLEDDIKADVLIIGGGITGILCAYKLKQSGVDCVIAEADEICGGVTQNTTAKVTLHHGAIFSKMLDRFGVENTALYLKANEKALLEYKKLCREIDCDFKEVSSFVYSLNDRAKIEKEVYALNKAGIRAYFTKDLPLPFEVEGAVEIKNQGQFNPLKFAYSIARDLNIYENTRVIKLTPDGAITEKGKIKAERIIVATHFPFINKHGSYFLKMYQYRSYVLALSNAPQVNGIYVDENEKGLSFRDYGDFLLLGGGGHKTGKKGGSWAELTAFAKLNYPNAEEAFKWATQDCETLDSIPYIGQYSKNTPELFVATGFNKWGMTSSMVAANILTDLIKGKQNQYERVFSPQRSILRPQLLVNGAEAIINLLTPTAPRCPHLGCALKYNPYEHSWDCPCHGSRFSETGELLDNPATGNIKPK